MIDLHMHSTASDGTDTPAEIITKCKKLNLQLCSITDHDTIDSQQPAAGKAAELRIDYLTGVEFSVVYEGELHILGYGIDINETELKSKIGELQKSRIGRINAIIEKLEEVGVEITIDDVKRYAKGETVGRPHVASVLVEKGYAGDMQDAFTKYLNENGSCYVSRRKLSVKEAVGLIKGAGGTPVIAHPKFVHTPDFEAFAVQMKKEGMEGIEAYYPAHTDKEVAEYVRIARALDMIVTGGSDYHGSLRPRAAIACEKREGELLARSVAYLKDKYVNRCGATTAG